MMKGLAFEIKSTMAHFRRPDTTATQVTYPFITPTAAKGLVGAVLGLTDFVTRDKVGIELLSPIRTVAQQLSMLGKDGGTTFNRPTTIELIVNPAYRIYYAGEEYAEQLLASLRQDKSVYSTYMGVAYALTKPVLNEEYDVVPIRSSLDIVETRSVVPTALVQEIRLVETRYYCRAGGYLYSYKGERTFEKSIDFIYEKNGKTISFVPKRKLPWELEIARFGDDLVCLI
jgi:CRISPR-associated protein Cas5h